MSSVKLKIKNDTNSTLVNLFTHSTIRDLIEEIRRVTDVGNDHLDLLFGFPPKPINMDLNLTLSEAKIISGDCIILKKQAGLAAKRQKLEESPEIVPEADRKRREEPLKKKIGGQNECERIPGILTKHEIPADNSCLFASVYFCLNEASLAGFDSAIERQLIAATLLSQPTRFDAAMLEGKTVEEYSSWIQDDNRWGGSIELDLMSRLHQLEIDVVNIDCDRIDRFGEDGDYREKILILYDGIHYDALVMKESGSGKCRTRFQMDDNEVEKQAKQLARQLQSNKQFTNVNSFKVQCRDCQQVLVGQKAAVQHASATGHSNFGEINST